VPRYFMGDCNRICQVLNNLLMNAAKFTESGEIQTSIQIINKKDQNTTLLFEVIDTGIGIAPDILARLFQPFTQGDASISRKYGGTGLGLVISKRLVEAMGGEIGVKSLPERGSKFWFTIPLIECEPIVSSAPTKRGVPQDKKDARILLAEDNAINLQVILRILKTLGYQADAISNGLETLQAFKTKPYDLILLDCQMPEMDGYAVTREIRKLETNHHIPIIALTAHAVDGDREKCLSAGMDDYLTKPINVKMLAETLKKWLSHDQSHPQ
jgi:CheY-like chemotaxis protein